MVFMIQHIPAAASAGQVKLNTKVTPAGMKQTESFAF